MKKSVGKIVIGVFFIAVMAAGIYIGIIKSGSTEEKPVNHSEIIINEPKDYTITKDKNILVNNDSYVHTDDTVAIGTLEDIVYAGDKISSFVMLGDDGQQYKVFYYTLDLISTETIKTEDEDGMDEVKLYFRTGGTVTLTEGKSAKLYKNAEGNWTPDERLHKSTDAEELAGIVEDFVFLPSYEQEGDIYISHIIIKDSNGEKVNIYPYNLETTVIKSSGEMVRYYAGNIGGRQVFDTKEKNNFSIIIKTKDGDFLVKKGEELKIEKNSDKGYWEISKNIDSTRYEAVVEGFEFGHNNNDITSLDYINLAIDEDTKIQITMLQTQADSAVPYGNYRKTYTYYGHDKMLTDIEPADDWRVELYYSNDIILDLSIGASVWVYKNNDDIWVVDYLYNHGTEAEEELGSD